MSKAVWHQIRAIFPVNFDEFSMGLAYGWTAPIIIQLQNSSHQQEFRLTEEECSWIASLHNIGRTFGPFLAAFLVDVIGRKFLLVGCSLTFFCMWLVVLFTRNVWALYAVRAIFGLAFGVHDSISNIYIAENSSPAIRGTFASVAMAFFNGGELVAFILATYLTYDQVAAAHAATTFVFLLFDFFLREPVQFLLMKGRHKSAEKNFYWLNGASSRNRLHFEEIANNVRQEQQKLSWTQVITSRPNYLSLRIIFVVSILSMFTGYEAVTSYASVAFSSSAWLTQNEFTILFGVFQLAAVCLSSFIIDKFGRRTLFLSALVSTAIVHCVTSALYYVHAAVTPIPHFPWLIFATITLYSVIYSLAIMPVYYILRGELFPQSMKAVGNCVGVLANAVVGFFTTKMFLYVSTHFGMHCNFLLFGVVSFLASIYVYFELPETKGKTLVEIQRSLEN